MQYLREGFIYLDIQTDLDLHEKEKFSLKLKTDGVPLGVCDNRQ